jgi:DNA-binding transcriptional LysR family regulator
MITLRQLEIFLAVARRQHVTEAAREVHLSQSAVSAALAELAERLGGALFERSGRRLALNDRGRQLADDAADLLSRVAELERRYTGAGTISGRLRLGASSTIGAYLLPGLVGSFVAEHPAVDVDLEVGNTAAIEDLLVQRRIDLAYIEGPARQPQVAATPWRRDELQVFVAPAHALARRRALAPDVLVHERWILREPGSGTRSVFEAELQRHGLQVGGSLSFGNSEAVKQAVRTGLGIGCLSALALRREVAAGEFKVLRVPALDLRRQLWRITRRGAFASALLQACIAHVEQPAPVRRRSGG